MKKLCRNIVFTKTPLKGGFVFKDHLQVYPCPYPKAPRSNRCDYPVVLEFWINEAENPPVETPLTEYKDLIALGANQQSRAARLTRLLSAITNHRFAVNQHPAIRWGWHLPEKADATLNQQSSSTYIDWYTYPEMRTDLEIKTLELPSVAPAPLVAHKSYFVDDPLEGSDREITFSDATWKVLNNYHATDARSRQVVDKVAHLICNGLDLRSNMKSLSFLAFVSSIETLCSYHYSKDDPKSCETCNQQLWGVAKKFKTFLKTFVASHPESAALYGRVYGLRSKIVHQGALLLGDEEMLWTKSDKVDSEWRIHVEAMQLARLALTNWLLMSAKPAEEPHFA